MESVKDRVKSLRPVRYKGLAPAVDDNGEFDMGDDGRPKTIYEDSFGLIAEEVQENFPDLVYTVPMDDGSTSLGVLYDRLPVYNVQAIKELQSEIDELRALVSALRQGRD